MRVCSHREIKEGGQQRSLFLFYLFLYTSIVHACIGDETKLYRRYVISCSSGGGGGGRVLEAE